MLDAPAALAALAEPLRLRTVRLLAREELQVREIQRVLGAAQSRVSNHLAVLRRAGLVETRKANGSERYASTAAGEKLWEAVAPSFSDGVFGADDRRLADILLERSASAPSLGFDAVASDWDRIQAPFYASGAREAALMRLVPRGLVVADVGCGTGLLTLTLAQVAERVIAIDDSPRMVRLARQKAEDAGLSNVDVKRGRAEKLPLATGSVDALFAFHLLRHLPEPAGAVQEFARVLKPGGRFVAVELEPHGVRSLREATGAVHLGLPRETVRGAMRKAGFTDARFQALPTPYRLPEGGGETTSLPAYIADAVRGARTKETTKEKETA